MPPCNHPWSAVSPAHGVTVNAAGMIDADLRALPHPLTCSPPRRDLPARGLRRWRLERRRRLDLGSDDRGAATTTTAPTPGGAPKTVTITVKNAAPVGGIQRATVAKGDNVVLVVHSDVADEIHVHGYNLMQDVAAGGTARITFVADVPGRFEAELEQHGTQIADLTVTP